MYEAALGLRHSPFSTPEGGSSVYWSKSHALAFDRLGFAARSRAPLTIFVGEPGTGRSTLIRELVRRERAERAIGLVADPAALSKDPCAAVLTALDAGEAGDTRDRNCAALADYLTSAASKGPAPLLIVDDADRLSDETLSTLYYFSVGEQGDGALLKLVLAGLPDLFERAYRGAPDIVGPSFELEPMSAKDTAAYVRHAVTAAGARGDLFDAGALEEVFTRTGGVPLKINAVCEGCLSQATHKGVSRIDRHTVRAAIAAFGLDGLISIVMRRALAESQTGSGIGEAESRPMPRSVRSAGASAPPPPPATMLAAALDSASRTEPLLIRPGGVHGRVAPRAAAAVPASRRPHTGAAQPEPAPPIVLSDAQRVADPPPTAAPAPTPRRRPAARRLVLAVTALTAMAGGAFYLADPGTPLAARIAVLKAETDAFLQDTLSRIVAGVPPTAPNRPAAAAPTPDLELLTRVGRIRTAVAAIPATAADRFRAAIEIGGDDPELAVVHFALAALHGHDRAAYYLGQIYETGEGVATNRGLARGWYGEAGTAIAGAVRGLAELAPSEPESTPGPPVPLYAGRMPDGSVELVWTGGDGAAPSHYRVELGTEPGSVSLTAGPLVISAIRVSAPGAARAWRVVAAGGPGSDEVASPWLPIDGG
ncbi:AAA family ATPase [Defluviimonas sp. WL0024]|uniref:AAA family ATPase n=1 Tax=Albidovulum salinarum TaxID=2984153 RepID=A0ABT2X722_9RHOB|nr:AAA family ATPase [Defluviimonas sp. WL0024]MCU9849750.1 AAA family ATPase [Defluviimonas sp. WL0024]